MPVLRRRAAWNALFALILPGCPAPAETGESAAPRPEVLGCEDLAVGAMWADSPPSFDICVGCPEYDDWDEPHESPLNGTHLRIRVPETMLGWSLGVLDSAGQRLLLMEGRRDEQAGLYGYQPEHAPACLGEVEATDWTPPELVGSSTLWVLDSLGDAALVRAHGAVQVVQWTGAEVMVVGAVPDTGRRDVAAILGSDEAGVSVAVAEPEGALGEWLCAAGAGCQRTGPMLAAETEVYGVIRPSAVDPVLLVKQAPAVPLLVPMRWSGAGGAHTLAELCREDWYFDDGSNPMLGAAICDVAGDGMRDDVVVSRQPDTPAGMVALSLQMPTGDERVGKSCEDAGWVRSVSSSFDSARRDVDCADYTRDGDQDVMLSAHQESSAGFIATSREDPTWWLVGFWWGDLWENSGLQASVAAQVDLVPFLHPDHPDVIIGAPEPHDEQPGFVAIYPWELP